MQVADQLAMVIVALLLHMTPQLHGVHAQLEQYLWTAQ